MTQLRQEKGIVFLGFFPPETVGWPKTLQCKKTPKKNKNLADGGGREDEEEEW